MTNLRKQDVVPSSPSYRLIPLTQGQVAIVDAADFDWVNQWKWHAKWSTMGQCFYASCAMYRRPNGKWVHVPMHNFILKTKRGREGDHKNGDTLDNRRANLRQVTHRQNCINRRQRSDCTSGCTGVNWNKAEGKWKSHISLKKKKVHLGTFVLFEKAVASRKAAERKHYGSFVRGSFESRHNNFHP